MPLNIPVPAPQRRRRTGGIRDILGHDFISEPRLGVAVGVEYEDSGCSLPSANKAGCYDGLPQNPLSSSGVGVVYGIGQPFGQYAAVECFLGGDSDRTYLQQATDLLHQGEERIVESKLIAWGLAAATTATAADLTAAVAAAEEYADANYVGQPLIIVSRSAGVRGPFRDSSPILLTKNGTPVMATGMMPDANLNHVIVIGQPEVYAGSVIGGRAPKLSTNKDLAIAERVYAAAVDCSFRYLVTVA